MHTLTQENLARFQVAGKLPRAPHLRALLVCAYQDQGVLLRLSSRRTVLRIALAEKDWLLKVDVPQRPFESLRAHLRQPALMREQNNWKLLGMRWPLLKALTQGMEAQQMDPARGCFTRPWIEGKTGELWSPEECATAGRGLASLHQLGWTDPDLQPGDLLLNSQGQLIPLDLGHAHIRHAPTAHHARQGDLVRLLGGWHATQRQQLSPALLHAYRQCMNLPMDDFTLLRAAKDWARKTLHRQSRRCLRQTRDFEPRADGIQRTEGLVNGPSAVLHGRGYRLGRRCFRRLYELELHQLPALRPLQLNFSSRHWWQIKGQIPTPPTEWKASGNTMPKFSATELLAEFHSLGFCIDSSRPEALQCNEMGMFYLHDPRAVVPQSHWLA